MFNRVRGLWLSFVWILLLPGWASAQTASSATLAVPTTDAFPRIETYLDVRDAQGGFVHGLQVEDVRVLEDDRSVPVAEITELRPGAQIVVAINPGPSFAVRNSQGTSRFDFVADGLHQWARNHQGTTVDDWSILTTNGPELAHVSDPMEWASAIVTDTIDARQAIPSLDTLFRAVDIAADPPPRPGMGRGVLFVTPPFEGDAALPLQNLAAQAQQQGVHIFIWMVIPTGAPVSSEADPLIELANQTGGQFATFSGEETLPSLEDLFSPLRSIYRLVYNSQLTTSGAHQLVVEVHTGAETVTSAAQPFELDIQPPNPAFVSPILEIPRKPAEEAGLAAVDVQADDLLPTEQEFQVLVDFPDGRVRPLTSTALYVDGVLVAENLEPPFDRFTWDIRPYTTSEPHLLRVEARDSLGLVGTSIETVVKITVEYPRQSIWNSLYRHTPALAGLGVILAGAVLVLVLLLGGKIHPNTLNVKKRLRRNSDPVTQPVPVKNEPASRRLPGWVNRLQWPKRRVAPNAYAFLSRISDVDDAYSATPISILTDEITLGSDPNQATLVLNDPSVEALHARLVRVEEGSFRLADEGSVAGTWINYTPVSREGVKLEHGDLVHIGRIGFRFTLRQPGQVRKPVVTVQEVPQEKRS